MSEVKNYECIECSLELTEAELVHSDKSQGIEEGWSDKACPKCLSAEHLMPVE